MQKKIQAVWNNKKIQILKAAQQIFARYGYFKSTMDDIAQAMGMKKGSLYYYYKSKEDILKDVVNYESEQFLNALQKEIESLKTPQEKILRFLQFRTKEFMQLMNLHQVSIQAFLEATSILSEMYQECFEKEINAQRAIIEINAEPGYVVLHDTLAENTLMLFVFATYPDGMPAETGHRLLRPPAERGADPSHRAGSGPGRRGAGAGARLWSASRCGEKRSV